MQVAAQVQPSSKSVLDTALQSSLRPAESAGWNRQIGLAWVVAKVLPDRAAAGTRRKVVVTVTYLRN